MPTAQELLAIASAGGGMVINAAVLEPATLMAIASTAAREGGLVRIIGSQTLLPATRLALASAGQGHVILDFTVAA